MMWKAALLLVLLVACQGELPQAPPAPGPVSPYGRAIGGLPISEAQRPSWAAEMRYTDIEPVQVKDGEIVRVVVEKPASVSTKFYIHGAMYVFNKKSRVWERLTVDPSQSGKIVQEWVEDKATFFFAANKNRFEQGQNYVLTYWCIDTDTRDANGRKVFDCNTNKWGLGAFEFRVGFADILVETNLPMYTYVRSNETLLAEGTEYEASYLGPSGTVPVKVLRLLNSTAHKRFLAQNLQLLEPIWGSLSGVCGFVQQDRVLGTTITWLSNNSRVTVQTVLGDDPRISAYAQRYPSDCRLIDELRRLAAGQTGFCGNGIIEQGVEQCDGQLDSACPGACRPDCSCTQKGDPQTGMCGDGAIQQPNKNGVVETCEPPLKRDIVTGQIISGSLCFVRNPVSGAMQEGNCNSECVCVAGSISLPKCGNGVCDAGESRETCPADCFRDVSVPNVTAIVPQAGSTIQTRPMVFVIDARDDFGVSACTLSLNAGAAEPMQRDATSWTLAKSVPNGAQSAVFRCVDGAGNEAGVTVEFTVDVVDAANQTNATNGSQ